MFYSLLCRQEASRTAASVADIHRHAGGAERSQPPQHALVSISFYFISMIKLNRFRFSCLFLECNVNSNMTALNPCVF